MQKLFDLSARQMQLRLELQILQKQLARLEREQLDRFERVADPTGSDYWESISDTVLTAKAGEEIHAHELLLYHAPGIYRVKDVRPRLTTDGECWYFRPDRDIHKGEEFTIVLIYDSPEELELQAKGLAPHRHRGRDPGRAYTTEIRIPGRPGK